MTQKFIPNNDYEIMTPSGWEDFDGVIQNIGVDKPSREIITATGKSVVATLDHRFFNQNGEIVVSDLKIGDQIMTVDGIETIIDLIETILPDTYEIFNSESHHIYANGFDSHQCDEMAFSAANILEEMWTSLSPTLAATKGKSIITSTPKSDVDMFAKLWFGANDNTDEFGNPDPNCLNGEGKNGYYPFMSTWKDNPTRSPEWATKEIAKIGKAKFAQEHECEFVTDDSTLIDPMFLSQLKVMREPLFYTGTVRWYEEPQPNTSYLVGLDPSLGTGGDNAAIQVFSLPDLVQVAEWQSNVTVPRGQVTTLMQILHTLDGELRDHPDQQGEPEIFWTVENNTIGEAILVIIEDTGEDRFPGQMVNEKKKRGQVKRFRKGLTTDNRKKLAACSRFKSLIETGRLRVNSNNLLTELKNFVSSGASFAGKRGVTDDLVMATMLIVRMIDIVIDWTDGADILRERIGDDELFGNDEPPLPTVV